MDIFHCVLSAGMTKYVLRNRGSGHLVQMGCCGMTEKMGVKVFINADDVGSIAKDILQCPW